MLVNDNIFFDRSVLWSGIAKKTTFSSSVWLNFRRKDVRKDGMLCTIGAAKLTKTLLSLYYYLINISSICTDLKVIRLNIKASTVRE